MNWDGFLNTAFDVDEPQPEDLIVRQSTAESMFLCPGRVGHSRDEGFDDAPSEAMSRGSLEHLLIERHLTGKARLTSTDEIIELWATMLAEEGHDLFELADEDTIRTAVEEARVAYFAWIMWYQGQSIQPAAVEVQVFRPLGKIGERRVWLQGTPDFVATNHDLYDWKTSGRPWYEGKETTRIQAAIYAFLAFDDVTEHLPLKFHYLIYAWNTKQWEERTIEVTEENISAALMTMWQLARQIHTQSFPYTPYGESYGKHKRGWHCSAKYCGAWDICPGKGLVHDDVDLHEPRSRGW